MTRRRKYVKDLGQAGPCIWCSRAFRRRQRHLLRDSRSDPGAPDDGAKVIDGCKRALLAIRYGFRGRSTACSHLEFPKWIALAAELGTPAPIPLK